MTKDELYAHPGWESCTFEGARNQVLLLGLQTTFREKLEWLEAAETLALRMDRACANAVALAEFLAAHPRVRAVYYPGLPTHPQHVLSQELFSGFGALLSFELDPALDCFDFLNRLQNVALSSNLGDNRTLAIPVAHTIYWEMGAERRASMGIAESLIRISVGIEDRDDLLADFEQALAV